MTDELDFEYEDFVDPVETIAAADGVETGRPYVEQSILPRFFDEQGRPRSEPGPDASPELWQSHIDGLEAEIEEQEQAINPLEYEPGLPAGPLEEQMAGEARREVWGEQLHDDLAGHVRQMAASSEFGIRDEAAVQRVTSAIMGARQELFRNWLADGATIAQATEALGDINLEAGIAQALEQERYLKVTANTSLAQWRQGQAEDALAGRPQRPSVYDSPTLQRLARSALAYAARHEQRQELQRQANLRASGRGGW